MQGIFGRDPTDDEPVGAVDDDDRRVGAQPPTQRMHGDIPMAANVLVGDLLVTAPAPSLAAAPPPMPRAVADPPGRGSRRQVNFRLSADEHARLAQAARAFGMRPGALARLLTVRGVDRALYEERRDR